MHRALVSTVYFWPARTGFAGANDDFLTRSIVRARASREGRRASINSSGASRRLERASSGFSMACCYRRGARWACLRARMICAVARGVSARANHVSAGREAIPWSDTWFFRDLHLFDKNPANPGTAARIKSLTLAAGCPTEAESQRAHLADTLVPAFRVAPGFLRSRKPRSKPPKANKPSVLGSGAGMMVCVPA
jgi:hypothetical protein